MNHGSLPTSPKMGELIHVDYNDPTLYRDMVILYCPQKVGSTSVVTSIRLSAPETFSVMHTHEEVIFKSNVRENDIRYSDMVRNTCMKNIATGLPRKIYVIDIYRTPVERKISEFFHEMGEFHFNNTEDNIADYSLEKITKRFNDIFPHVSNEDYFKERYKTSFEYDNEKQGFDFNKKYMLIEKEGVHYIKLRLKDSKEWGSILTELLGCEITAVYDYETKDKKIGDLYKRFMESYRLPFNYFKMIENCPQMKCYYDFEERYMYLQEWWGKTMGLYTSYTPEQYVFYKSVYMENQCHFRKLFNHYKDDGCLCVKCIETRTKVLSQIKANGDTHLEAILHNIPENALVKSVNSTLVKVFNEKEDRFIVLSLMT